MKAISKKTILFYLLVCAAVLGAGPMVQRSEADLVLWWKFNEGSGTTVADSSGNGHSATLQGTPKPLWTNGVVSGALSFDGSQNYVGSDSAISQTFTATTMECWFTANSVSGLNPTILSTVHDDNPVYTAYLGALPIYNPSVRPDLGYLLSFFLKVNSAAAHTNAFDGNYHHVAGVWDGSQILFYYDGTLVASTNVSSSSVNANCYVRVAYADTNGGCFLGGKVGEVRIYDRPLSSNEVVASFNTDTVGDGIPNWWRMKYYGSGTSTNSSSCASCTSTNPLAHGLTNLQVYENPSVLISNNYSTVGDGIPDWWKITYGLSITDTNVASGDPKGDGYTNLEKYQDGLSPQVAIVNEWYGPFNSWTNVSAFGAVGNGTTDDTAAISNALAHVGLNGCSPVLYCPLKYKITKTLWLHDRENVQIVGADSATSGFIWGGSTGSSIGDATTMFHVDSVDTCFFERLFFDGQGKSFLLVNHSQTDGTFFDEGNTWTDCVLKNGATGGLGVAAGLYGSGFSNEAFLRCIFTNLSVAVETYNYNAIDGWMVNSYFANCGVGLQMSPGSLHAYQSVFVNNGTDVFNNTGNNFTSETGNTSWHSYQFYVDPANNGPVLIKGNTIIDPTGQPISTGQQGPFVVLDNLFAYNGGVAANFTASGTRAQLLGNTNCSSPFATFASGPVTNPVDNVTVSRGSLSLSQPGLPKEATNLNRTIVDMPTNFTSSTLQTAINSASDGTVIHLPFYPGYASGGVTYYSLGSTVTIPTNRDIRIVGDGPLTKLKWDGGSGNMFSLAYPSHATFNHVHLYGDNNPLNAGPLIHVSGVSNTSARVYLRDSSSLLSGKANLDLGDCPSTTIDWRSNHEAYSAGTGLLLEGRGTVKFIVTDSGLSAIDMVVTNGGTLYVETSYNEDDNNFYGYRDLLTSGASTVMILSGVQHEQSAQGGGDGFYPNGGTTNAFAVTNFSGVFTMSLVGGISDWVRISGTQSGNVWIEGDTTFNSPTAGGAWPIVNSTTFTPAQNQNWDYASCGGCGFSNYSSVGSPTPSYTRMMFAPARSVYSDLRGMAQRTNQTDVLIEDSLLEESTINLLVTP